MSVRPVRGRDLLLGIPREGSRELERAAQISTPISRAPAPDRLQQLGELVEQLARKLDELPAREFELRTATGRRFLRDLPTEWRTEQHRSELSDQRLDHRRVDQAGEGEREQDAQPDDHIGVSYVMVERVEEGPQAQA